MDQTLLTALDSYFAAGLELNLDRLDTLYAVDFTNLRIKPDGTVLKLTKKQFMTEFRTKIAAGGQMQPVDDVTVLATNRFGLYGNIVFRRTKAKRQVTYVFTWDLSRPYPTLLQEITLE